MKTTQNLIESNGELFRSIVNGKNFMTPHLLGYYSVTNGEAELTEGDFMGDDIYGVTVVLNNVHETELSKKCDSITEALNYISTLN